MVILKNTTNDADGARLRFVKDKGAAGAQGDDAYQVAQGQGFSGNRDAFILSLKGDGNSDQFFKSSCTWNQF